MIDQKVTEVSKRIANRDIRGSVTIAREISNAIEAQAKNTDTEDPEEFKDEMRTAAQKLRETRVGAVSVPNTLRFIFRNMDGENVSDLRETTVSAVQEFQQNLQEARETLGRIGARRISDGDTIMTHCHSTDALSIVKHALSDGKNISAIVKETRPRNQGHITAQQLREWEVPVTIIVDNAAYQYLDETDHVLAGAHSIAANGSVVNSVGTSTLTASAREQNVPVTIAAQTLKLHSDALRGENIDTEMRDASEVLDDAIRTQIGDVDIKNPVSDVTPPDYIDAIVTERGQFPPESIVTLIHDLYGEATIHSWQFGNENN